MQRRRLWGYSGVALLVALAIGVGVGYAPVFAETSTSPNYQITESQFGTGSSLESCSEAYCAHAVVGTNSQASKATTPELGKADYSEPLLQMVVESGASNLGDLTTEQTGMKTMTVKIRNYLSGGYMLQIIGEAPKYKNHVLNVLGTPTVSKPGTEQFGINVVKNTTPGVGADPVQQPSGTSAASLLKPNYNTPNKFMYQSGDTIALSQSDNGGADYTISMIVNISNSTPAGRYSGDFSAVVLPVY